MSQEIKWNEQRKRWVVTDNGKPMASSTVLSVLKRRFPKASAPKTPQKGKRKERRP